MPRPRKPLGLAIASGAYAKNPARYDGRNEPAVTDPIGDPPDWLGADAKAAWREYAATLPWLNASHRALVEIAAHLRGRLVAGGDVGTHALNLLRQCLGAMGATPADASKVNWSPEPDETDPADEFFA